MFRNLQALQSSNLHNYVHHLKFYPLLLRDQYSHVFATSSGQMLISSLLIHLDTPLRLIIPVPALQFDLHELTFPIHQNILNQSENSFHAFPQMYVSAYCFHPVRWLSNQTQEVKIPDLYHYHCY